jgi:hypothetical protein
VVGADGECVVKAEPTGLTARSRPPYTSSPASQRAAMFRVWTRFSMAAASCGFGGELHLVGDMGEQAAFLVLGPGGGQIQGTVDDGVTTLAGIGEVDGDLVQPHPSECPGVLAGRPAQSVEDFASPVSSTSNTALGSESSSAVQAGEPVTGQVVVEAEARKEVLQAVRAAVTESLGECPVVAGIQLDQYRLGHLPCHQPRFPAREAVRDLAIAVPSAVVQACWAIVTSSAT